MKTKITLSLLLATQLAYGFQDKDLDGIEDRYDRCPNTPFDAKVDKYGCAVKKTDTNIVNKGLTLRIGTIYRTDDVYDDDSSMNFYAGFYYDVWDFSISNIRSMTKSDYNQDYSNTDNDIYLSAGYTFYMPSTALKLSIGTKITGDDDSSQSRQGKYTFSQNDESRDNDYFGAVSLDHFISAKQDLFLYYSYTRSGDSPSYDYQDYSSFSIGSGYQFTRDYYSAISYNYTGSIYEDGDAEESLLWYNSYNLTKNLFLIASYSYALKDFSYDNTFTFAVGVHF